MVEVQQTDKGKTINIAQVKISKMTQTASVNK